MSDPLSLEGKKYQQAQVKKYQLFLNSHSLYVIDIMTCFSAVVVSIVPSAFVQVEAGDALHQVVSGCYLNLN